MTSVPACIAVDAKARRLFLVRFSVLFFTPRLQLHAPRVWIVLLRFWFTRVQVTFISAQEARRGRKRRNRLWAVLALFNMSVRTTFYMSQSGPAWQVRFCYVMSYHPILVPVFRFPPFPFHHQAVKFSVVSRSSTRKFSVIRRPQGRDQDEGLGNVGRCLSGA